MIRIFIIFYFSLPLVCFSQEHFFSSNREKVIFEETMNLYREGKILKFKEQLSKITNPHVKKTMEWLVVMHDSGEEGIKNLMLFYEKNPNWLLKKETVKKIEFMLNNTGNENLIKKWFSKNPPITSSGAKAELKIVPDKDGVKKRVQKIWLEYNFNHNEEKAFLQKYGTYLTNNDYFKKIDYLLWGKNYDEAKKLMRFITQDQKNLIKARIAFMKDEIDKELLLRSVKKEYLKNEGLLYSIMLRAAEEKQHEKFNSYLSVSGKPDDKFFRSKWCKLLAMETRNLLENKLYEEAYQLSLKSCKSSPAEIVESDWLSGWIALRFMKNAALSRPHFESLLAVSKMSLSKSRALYWLGRSYEFDNNIDLANDHYLKASSYPLTYYGQLALHRLGKNTIENFFHEDKYHQSEYYAKLRNNKLVATAYVLSYTKYYYLAHALMNDFLENNATEEEKRIVIDLVRFDDRKDLALVAAKKASSNKIINLSACYPYYKNSFIPDPALVNSLIRQESLFNSYAVSSAGAVGLMQIMPFNITTFAKQAKFSLPNNNTNILTNPDVNLRLGSHHIEFLKQKFNGSKILAIASYNAGDHRATDWIKRFGDPRQLNSLDEIIDWVEKIPFSETRNYVQRVMENLQVYNSLLSNKKDFIITIHNDLRLGRLHG